ncbi:MAG: aspartate/glutamate racemase family protein [Candidatus Woesearchaeota archaeon]|nr:aspartate/glutamate racemase family protein [Candidatus Woesearchaeota archaeon]
MKTIGLVGGMSWESTAEYYRIINEEINKRLGTFHSAQIAMYSVDFEEIEQLQRKGAWSELSDRMIEAAKKVQAAGADLVLLCTNTMHETADAVQKSIDIPLLHIADATAERILVDKYRRIALLGTKYTMERDFYKGRLLERGIEILIPEERDRENIQHIIYEELCRGDVREKSREIFREIITTLARRGAEGVILGCTEIPMLIKQKDSSIPVYDTTRIHAEIAVEHALMK